MREIKFRFRLAKEGEKDWVLYQSLEDMFYLSKISSLLHEGYKVIARDEFTGLKDKNGIEIYEGDIVKVHSDGRYKQELHQFVVNWDNDYACFEPLSIMLSRQSMEVRLGNPTTEFEVIGNIYENPDLLESKVCKE